MQHEAQDAVDAEPRVPEATLSNHLGLEPDLFLDLFT